jgi:hypothetical protein
MSTRFFVPAVLVCLSLAVSGCDVKVGENGLSFDVAEGKVTDEWTRTYTLAAGGRLEVVNINGPIEAFPATGGQVEIVARREARGRSDEEAQQLLEEAVMTEEIAPDRVMVGVPPRAPGQSGPLGRRFINVQFRVSVPEGLDVWLKTENGPVRVENVKSRVTINSTNGGVTVRGVSGSIDAQTVNGGITVDMASVTGDMKVGTVNGGIRLNVPSDTNADLEAHAVNGGVSVDDAFSFSATQQERQHIVGRLNRGGSKISAQTVNGGVRIAVRAAN